MKVSTFLDDKKDIPTLLLGAFYGRFELSKDRAFIYTYSCYRNSKHTLDNPELCSRSKVDYVDQLNDKCAPFKFWKKRDSSVFNKSAEIVFSLENDLNLDRQSFFNKLFRKIISCDFVYESGLTYKKRLFIIGFAELRGSIDKNRHMFSMDYTFETISENRRVRLLVDNLNVPVPVLNYNFREFQPEFMEGKERATQLRFDIEWYAKNIGFINNYKFENFKRNFYYCSISEDNGIRRFDCHVNNRLSNITFEQRIAFYGNNVFDKRGHLTSSDLKKFQQLINSHKIDDGYRSRNLSNLFRCSTDEECAYCHDIYDRDTRVVKNPTTGLFNFQIHHMISLGGNSELDVYDNLVKLCPGCHDVLKANAASEEIQKRMIAKILIENPNNKHFCESFFNETDFNKLIDYIYHSLK